MARLYITLLLLSDDDDGNIFNWVTDGGDNIVTDGGDRFVFNIGQ